MRIFLIITILLNLSSPVFSQFQNTVKLDSLFKIFEDNDKVFGSIHISVNGKVAYNRTCKDEAFNIETGLDHEVPTQYRIASITKIYTAVIILQLIEQNKLSLKTKLNDFFPKLPNAKKISIRHLLTHQSGLHNYTDDSLISSYEKSNMNRDSMIKIFNRNEIRILNQVRRVIIVILISFC